MQLKDKLLFSISVDWVTEKMPLQCVLKPKYSDYTAQNMNSISHPVIPIDKYKIIDAKNG